MNFYRSKASVLAKVAKLPIYQNPADLLHPQIIPIKKQNLQIQGKLPFGQNNYSSILHQNLIKDLAQLRNSSENINQEYSLWKGYGKAMVAQLKQEQQINETQKQNIFEAMLIAKERNQQKLVLTRLLKCMDQYSKDLESIFHCIRQFSLGWFIHIFGYMNNFPNKLTLDQLYYLLNQMTAASSLLYRGYTLHASQLMSLYFWGLYTNDNKGYMDISEFCEFLKLFKFTLNNESQFCIQILNTPQPEDK